MNSYLVFSEPESTAHSLSGDMCAVEKQERKRGIDREGELRGEQCTEYVCRFAATFFLWLLLHSEGNIQ